MSEVVGIVGKIAWSHNGWRGFDREGFEKKKKYGYPYVKETGFGYEWWNFHEEFDEKYYFGNIETGNKQLKKFRSGIIIFISRNIKNEKFYFVGFYGKAEYSKSGFNTKVKIIELLPDDVIKKLREEVENIREKFRKDIKKILSGEITYEVKFRGEKELSAVFDGEAYLKINLKDDLGLKKLGQGNVVYIGENEKIKPQKIYQILVRVKQKHEELLKEAKVSEERKKNIRKIIRKIDQVVNRYFGGFKTLERRPRLWLIKPGEEAEMWNECIKKGEICVSWVKVTKKLGEKIIKINDYNEFSRVFKKLGEGEEGYKNPSQLWSFLKKVSVGDIAIAMKGEKKIIGIGIVKSKVYIDTETESDYPVCRKVDWVFTDLDLESPKTHKATILELKWSDLDNSLQLKKLLEELMNKKQHIQKDTLEPKIKESLDRLLKNKKQIILYGPPGTGKTWLSREYVKEVADDKKWEFVTLHPSYSYEEFVEGIRPETANGGQIKYKVKEGVFKRICRKAFNSLLNSAGIKKKWEEGEDLPELKEEEKRRVKEIFLDKDNFPKYFLIIDEINRGDISKIFGELITLLESDKRLFEENEVVVTLPYSKKKFGVPPNLYIIGTMNTADRSIALIDVAIRRRFGFKELMPNYDVLKGKLKDDGEVGEIKELAVKVLKSMNEKIKKIYDRDHQIGHSYFLRLEKCESREDVLKTLKEIWFYEIIPLLQEYFYDSPKKLKDIAGDFVDYSEDSYEIKSIDDFADEEFLKALRKITGESGG